MIISLIVAGLFVTRPKPAENLPPVTILSEPYKIPVTPRDRLALTFPNNRLVWRLENALFGPRKPISINTRVFSISTGQATNVENFLQLGEPAFANSTGLRIWLPGRAVFEKSTDLLITFPQIEMIGGPRVATAEGIAASVFMGQSIPLNGITNTVGFSLECIGQTREGLVDLVTTVVDSELHTNRIAGSTQVETNSISVLTNLSVRARWQIPKGHGVLLIQFPAPTSDRKALALFIDPLQ
jgi:hypothetical protein